MGNYISFYSTTQNTDSNGNDSGGDSGNNENVDVDNGHINTIHRQYGWKRDKPDERDLTRNFHYFTFLATPKIDLRKDCPEIYNQGQLGSCTANAIAAAYEFDQIKQKSQIPQYTKDSDVFIPSRLFIYYNERDMEGNVDQDSGAEIRDGIKSINKIGVCPETMWPYDISKFTEKPGKDCYQDAKNHEAVNYHRVKQDLDHLRQCLCGGFPFVFGFEVFPNFETEEVADTGKMQMPEPNTKSLGGHAVMAVGFDDSQEHFIVRNSWGESWGDQGYFYMPYDFIKNTDYCADFWTVTRVKDFSKAI